MDRSGWRAAHVHGNRGAADDPRTQSPVTRAMGLAVAAVAGSNLLLALLAAVNQPVPLKQRLLMGTLYVVPALAYFVSFGMWRDGDQTRRWQARVTLALAVIVLLSFAAWTLEPFGS